MAEWKLTQNASNSSLLKHNITLFLIYYNIMQWNGMECSLLLTSFTLWLKIPNDGASINWCIYVCKLPVDVELLKLTKCKLKLIILPSCNCTEQKYEYTYNRY